MEIPINGIAMVIILNLKPTNETNQAVTVVPILAPIMTVIDSASDNNPAFTKLTTITVVALDDRMMEVMATPVNTPITRFLVMLAKMVRILSPATFCKASLIMVIPKRNKPNDPHVFRKSKNEDLKYFMDRLIKDKIDILHINSTVFSSVIDFIKSNLIRLLIHMILLPRWYYQAVL